MFGQLMHIVIAATDYLPTKFVNNPVPDNFNASLVAEAQKKWSKVALTVTGNVIDLEVVGLTPSSFAAYGFSSVAPADFRGTG